MEIRITRCAMAAAWLGLLAATPVIADTHYVAQNGQTPKSPYTNWAMASSNIQDAVNAAGYYNAVLVTNGVYDTGGTSAIRPRRARGAARAGHLALLFARLRPLSVRCLLQPYRQ